MGMACESLSGYISNDYDDKISFLSTKLPTDGNIATLVKQAAVRSLSCEVVPGKEGQIYFGDSTRGHVLSHTFFLQDAQARGFHRWYSIIVFMKDKYFLLNSWPFFQKHLKRLVLQLQNKASQVYNCEQNECPQRALRLSFPDSKQPTSNKVARSISELTNMPNVFTLLHLWFTWLLSAGSKRLKEDFPENSPTRKIDCYFKHDEETEGGFFVVEEVEAEYEAHIEHEDTVVEDLRNIRNVLGDIKFQSLLYSLFVGHQIVVRGPKNIVKFVINALKFLLPVKCIRSLDYTDIYLTPDICNVIGLNMTAAVPLSAGDILRVDVVPQDTQQGTSASSINESVDLRGHLFVVKWGGVLPTRLPTLLQKVNKALSDQTLSHKVVFLHIKSLMEQWTYTGELIGEVKKKNLNQDLTELLQSLGAQEQDYRLVQFWSRP